MDFIEAMAQVFVDMIHNNTITLAQVPQTYQETVKTKLENRQGK